MNYVKNYVLFFFQVYAERESAKIIRKIGDRVIIQRDSKLQYSLDEVI